MKFARIKRRLGRLRVQFALYIAALLIVFTAAQLAVNWRGQEQIVLDRLEAHVGYVADLTAVLAADRLRNGDNAALSQIIEEIVELEDAMAIAIVDLNGEILVEGRGDAIPADFVFQLQAMGVHEDLIDAGANVIVDGQIVAFVHLSRTLRLPGSPAGQTILGNAAFGGEVESSRAILQRSALIGLAMFLLAIPLAILLINRATRGISAVTRAANRASSGDLTVEIPQSGSGEVAELQTAFRTMQSAVLTSIGEIEKLAFVDRVTGLANRARFEEDLSAALSDNGLDGGALLMIDVDHFKGVNDSHGHQFGDALLKAAGSRLAAFVEDEGVKSGIKVTSLACFSADEFTLLIRCRVGGEMVRLFAEGVVALMEEPFEIDGVRINIGCSVGVALVEDGAEDAVELLRQADLAMYAAKADGRRRAKVYTADVKSAATRRASIESDLRHAIRSGSLKVFYQPVLDCRTLTIKGAEALVRWNHPTKGPIPPSEFVPIAEASGLVIDIGSFVLSRSLADFRALSDEGHVLSLAVNVAAMELQKPDFASSIVAALDRWGFPANCLELELTESTALVASDRPREVIAPLQKVGVKFAIDDFGTGYSSLGRLPGLGFDILKIDQSFVGGLAGNADNQTIVRLVTSLANSLGMEIVAEGVEQEEDFLALSEYGVQYSQGFMWSPALPFAEFAELVRMFRATSDQADPDQSVEA